MSWQSIGADTWRQGRFILYKSRLPQEVYWLSIDGRAPIRCETKEIAQAEIKAANEWFQQTNGQNK